MDPAACQSHKSWRRAQRAALVERRMAITPDDRKRWDAAIERTLHETLIVSGAGVIGLYWPFKGEFNTRGLMQRLDADGVRVALPDAVAPKTPLVFRPWHTGAPMRRGVYGIPVPEIDAEIMLDAVVAPLVGFDVAGYRLGYGGGYYDRTLAAFQPAPLVVGVGYELSRIPTIRPRAHDVPMSQIVTEAGRYDRHDAGGLAPAHARDPKRPAAPISTHPDHAT